MAALITIGALLGMLTQPESILWYNSLHRSPLTPPNYLFPIVWTLLYGMLGICGWMIWSHHSSQLITKIKYWYRIQLILNWSWPPLFFYAHAINLALIVLILMNAIMGRILWLSYEKIQQVTLLLIPYCIWILFALYLNYYIWQHNC
jgi:tryptophan-rich sensory protein